MTNPARPPAWHRIARRTCKQRMARSLTDEVGAVLDDPFCVDVVYEAALERRPGGGIDGSVVELGLLPLLGDYSGHVARVCGCVWGGR